MASDVDLDNTMCQGKMAINIDESRAIRVSLNNSLVKRYIGNIVSAPMNAIENLVPNSLAPNIKVERPDSQNMPIGRKSPNLFINNGKTLPYMSCPFKKIYRPTYPANSSSVWRLKGNDER